MAKISALTFLYNEQTHLEKSLQALRPYVDEILIVDTESTDRSYGIGLKHADKIWIRPWGLCGDQNKNFLYHQSTGDWLLWFYPDELWVKQTCEKFKELIEKFGNEFDTFSFMRREYMDGTRLLPHGTDASPNYQNRLHRKCDNIFYTGLVHAEIHRVDERLGKNCTVPGEYFMEHHKTSVEQEYDNIRLYIWYKYSIWLYGNTSVSPFKTYVDSYKKIVRDSEARNLSGDRGIHLSEEFWQDWRKYADMGRITLVQFKEIAGMEYAAFLEGKKSTDKEFTINRDIIDKAIKEQVVKTKEE